MEQNNNTQTSTRGEANINQYRKILEEMNELYARKNHDYGDSFHLLWEEEGIAMARIRLGDKFSRFKALSRGSEERQVKDESLRDTLIDLANYAIMTVMELDREKSRRTEQHPTTPVTSKSPSGSTKQYAAAPEKNAENAKGDTAAIDNGAIQLISPYLANTILENHAPLGRFYTWAGGRYVGIDNRTGHPRTESFSFSDIQKCWNWLIDRERAPVEVSPVFADSIIESRKPLGQFFVSYDNLCVGIDNSTGDAWTEEFPDLRSCFQWLRRENEEEE